MGSSRLAHSVWASSKRSCSCSSLPEVNLTSDATYRIRLDETPLSGIARVLPTAITATSGPVVGTLDSVDQGVDTPSSEGLVLGNATASVTFGFGPMGGTLQPGAENQLARVLAEVTASETKPFPFHVAVLEGGSEIAAGDFVAEGAAAQVFELGFDAAALADPSDAAVELRISIDGSDRHGRSLKVSEVEIVPELTAAVVDTGWRKAVVDPLGFSGVPLSRLAQGELSSTLSHIFFDTAGQLAPVTYQHLRIDLRDPRNPDGYVRAGVLGAGPGTSDLRLQEDFEVVPRSLTRLRRMPQGGVWRRRGRSYWAAQLPIQAASDVGVTDLLNTLYNLGRDQDFLVSILPQQPNEGQVLSFWGTLAEEENAVRFEKVQRSGSPDPYAWGSVLHVGQLL